MNGQVFQSNPTLIMTKVPRDHPILSIWHLYHPPHIPISSNAALILVASREEAQPWKAPTVQHSLSSLTPKSCGFGPRSWRVHERIISLCLATVFDAFPAPPPPRVFRPCVHSPTASPGATADGSPVARRCREAPPPAREGPVKRACGSRGGRPVLEVAFARGRMVWTWAYFLLVKAQRPLCANSLRLQNKTKGGAAASRDCFHHF